MAPDRRSLRYPRLRNHVATDTNPNCAQQKILRELAQSIPHYPRTSHCPYGRCSQSMGGIRVLQSGKEFTKAAQAIDTHWNGKFPQTVKSIESLPGIGKYTAGAVASFAFNLSVPIVDANVIRVFSRIFNYAKRTDTNAGKKFFWEKAARLIPQQKAREYNSALMELGQKFARPKPSLPSVPYKNLLSL